MSGENCPNCTKGGTPDGCSQDSILVLVVGSGA